MSFLIIGYALNITASQVSASASQVNVASGTEITLAANQASLPLPIEPADSYGNEVTLDCETLTVSQGCSSEKLGVRA